MLKVIHDSSTYLIEGCPESGLEAVQWRLDNGFQPGADNKVYVGGFSREVGLQDVALRRKHANKSADLVCIKFFPITRQEMMYVREYDVHIEVPVIDQYNSAWCKVFLPVDVLKRVDVPGENCIEKARKLACMISPECALDLFDALVDAKEFMRVKAVADLAAFEATKPLKVLEQLNKQYTILKDKNDLLRAEITALKDRVKQLEHDDDDDEDEEEDGE